MKAGVIHGLMAEFDDPTSLVTATERAYGAGYRCMDAYSPFPIEELHEALGGGHTGCRSSCSSADSAVASAATAAVLVVGDGASLNIGGKPLHSWPAFIPVTFSHDSRRRALRGCWASWR
jgi:hypothetical protein